MIEILPSISANVVSSSSAASVVDVTSSASFSISCSICTVSSVSVSLHRKIEDSYLSFEIYPQALLLLL
jgi:hypothetical protein